MCALMSFRIAKISRSPKHLIQKCMMSSHKAQQLDGDLLVGMNCPLSIERIGYGSDVIILEILESRNELAQSEDLIPSDVAVRGGID